MTTATDLKPLTAGDLVRELQKLPSDMPIVNHDGWPAHYLVVQHGAEGQTARLVFSEAAAFAATR